VGGGEKEIPQQGRGGRREKGKADRPGKDRGKKKVVSRSFKLRGENRKREGQDGHVKRKNLRILGTRGEKR